MQPSRSRLRVVLCICCLEWVFLRAVIAKPRAATTSNLGLCANMTSSYRKYITYHYAAREGPSHGTGNMHKKYGEDRISSSEDMIAERQTQRNRHGHQNTPFPYQGGQQQQQQRPFNGLWSRTTRVDRYQKELSPTHTHPDHRASYITFLHLQRSMAVLTYNLRAE